MDEMKEPHGTGETPNPETLPPPHTHTKSDFSNVLKSRRPTATAKSAPAAVVDLELVVGSLATPTSRRLIICSCHESAGARKAKMAHTIGRWAGGKQRSWERGPPLM